MADADSLPPLVIETCGVLDHASEAMLPYGADGEVLDATELDALDRLHVQAARALDRLGGEIARRHIEHAARR